MSVMNIVEGERPNLKPLRAVDPHDVIGFFAHVSGKVNKGSLVSLVTASGNVNVKQGGSTPLNPYLSNLTNAGLDNLPAYVYSNQSTVAWTVNNSSSGQVPLGFLLNDVRTKDSWGNDMHWEHQKRAEGDIVESGTTVPIATRGLLMVNGIQGTPTAGDAAYVSATVPGEIDSSGTTTKTRVDYVGKFLTSKDADGFALLKVEL